ARRGGAAPPAPRRGVWRLGAVRRAAGPDRPAGGDKTTASAAGRVADPASYRPLPPAAPCPPLAARPRQLSVTQIETWLRDPYAIYARHILELKPLDELDAIPGRADLGTAIHNALDEFVHRWPPDIPQD